MPSNDDKVAGFLRENDEFMPKEKRSEIMENMKINEQYVVGPKGEIRPADDCANAVRVMEIALGLAEEKYVEDEDEKD